MYKIRFVKWFMGWEISFHFPDCCITKFYFCWLCSYTQTHNIALTHTRQLSHKHTHFIFLFSGSVIKTKQTNLPVYFVSGSSINCGSLYSVWKNTVVCSISPIYDDIRACLSILSRDKYTGGRLWFQFVSGHLVADLRRCVRTFMSSEQRAMPCYTRISHGNLLAVFTN